MSNNITDTIKIRLTKTDYETYIKKTWDAKVISERIDDKVTIIKEGKKTYRGKKSNFKIFLTNDFVEITGSLPKYYYQTNLRPLEYEDTRPAITRLCKELGLPLWYASVRRLDLTRNLVLTKPIQKYLECFTDTYGYDGDNKRNNIRKGMGRTYIKDQPKKSVVFYDKNKELKNDEPDLYWKLAKYLPKHILRCEVQLQQNLKNQLKFKSDIKVAHLLGRNFLSNLNKLWYKTIRSISTIKTYELPDDIQNWSQLEPEFKASGIDRFGEYQVRTFIKEQGN